MTTLSPRRALAAPPEVAEHLGVTVQALALLRHKNDGPAFVRLGRRIRYRWDDVEAWLDANHVDTRSAS